MATPLCPHHVPARVPPHSPHLLKLHGIQPTVLYHGLGYSGDIAPLNCTCTLDLREWTEFAEDEERDDLNTGFPDGDLDYTDYLAKPTTFQPAEAIWSTLPEEFGKTPGDLLQASIRADELGLKDLLLHFAARVLKDLRNVRVGQTVVVFQTPGGMKTGPIDLRHVQLSLLEDLWEGQDNEENEEKVDKYEAEEDAYCNEILQNQYDLFLYQFGRLIHDNWMVPTDWAGGSVPTTDQLHNFMHVLTKYYTDILAAEALEAAAEEDYSQDESDSDGDDPGEFEHSTDPDHDDPRTWTGHYNDEKADLDLDIEDSDAERSHCPSIRAKAFLPHLLLGVLKTGKQGPAGVLFGPSEADAGERLRLLRQRNVRLNRLNMALFLMFEVATEILCGKKVVA